MKTRVLKITPLACTLFALAFSLGAAPLPPEGSFRLNVEEILQSDHCRVVRLKVEARAGAEMMEMRCADGSGGSVVLASAAKGKTREGTMAVASMLCESNSACHVTTVLESRPGGGSSASGHGSYDLAPEATLTSVVSLTVTNGLYKLNRPLTIGRRNGHAMQLIVGSWNWEQQVSRK
jgi:hypothetical protein